MRAFKATRRRARSKPVEFDYVYEVEADQEGEKVWVEQTEHFICVGKVDQLMLSEIAWNADVEVATPEAMGLIRQFFAEAFGDEAEYRRFFRLHVQYGDDAVLMSIVQGLLEDFSEGPTQELSSSADGPPETTTGEPSKVVSLSRGTVQIVPSEAWETTSESASSG